MRGGVGDQITLWDQGGVRLCRGREFNFASAAFQHSEFARELPKFIAQVRRMFTREDMRVHIARLEHERNEKSEDAEEDELFHESPVAAAERDRQFTTIKEFLTAVELGTS